LALNSISALLHVLIVKPWRLEDYATLYLIKLKQSIVPFRRIVRIGTIGALGTLSGKQLKFDKFLIIFIFIKKLVVSQFFEKMKNVI
jgi:hypothetical protein